MLSQRMWAVPTQYFASVFTKEKDILDSEISVGNTNMQGHVQSGGDRALEEHLGG